MPTYQRALNDNGYNYQLHFHADKEKRKKKRERRRNVTWFNPPYSKHVATDIGKKFLNIVNSAFGKKHPLRKIFNRNTLKISYSCMPSLEKKISAHNKSVLRKNNNTTPIDQKTCSCRSKANCPLNGVCLTRNIIYQATVESNTDKQTYIGLTSDEFKSRYRNHTASFRHKNKGNATELSKYIWSLKDAGTPFTISWKIIARAAPYSNATKRCNLCLLEKYFIICRTDLCSLNKRNELTSSCRHASKHLLKNFTVM